MPTTAGASEFHFSFLDNGTATFVDITTLRPVGGSNYSPPLYHRVWETTVRRQPDRDGVQREIYQYEYSCQSETSRMMFSAHYDADGQVLGSGPVSEVPSPIIPNTNASVSLQIVCNGLRRAEPLSELNALDNPAFWTASNFRRLLAVPQPQTTSPTNISPAPLL